MPQDYAIHPGLLVYWTGARDIDPSDPNWPEGDSRDTPPQIEEQYLQRLRDILKLGLWMTPESGTVPFRDTPLPEVARICFTELKLSQSRTHAQRYGRLGIGFKRPYVFQRGGRPVVYYSQKAGNNQHDYFF